MIFLTRLVIGALASVVGLVVTLFVALVVLNAVGVVHLYRVPSSSMEPTLHCARPAPLCRGSRQDRIVTLPYWFSSPKVGDIVAFHTPPAAVARCGSGGVFLKRIVRLVRGRYFMEGDNRGASCDSRVWGTVARSAIIGKVWATYWPPTRLTIR